MDVFIQLLAGLYTSTNKNSWTVWTDSWVQKISPSKKLPQGVMVGTSVLLLMEGSIGFHTSGFLPSTVVTSQSFTWNLNMAPWNRRFFLETETIHF